MKVIISMSGLSSRFSAAGYDIPKFMIEVDGKTVIQHIIELYPVDSDFLLIINDDHKKDQEDVKSQASYPYAHKNMDHRNFLLFNHKHGC